MSETSFHPTPLGEFLAIIGPNPGSLSQERFSLVEILVITSLETLLRYTLHILAE